MKRVVDSPRGGSDWRWKESYEKAAKLVSKMSLAEKVNVTTGIGWSMGPCVGNTGSTSVGFPRLCLQDGPLGVRFADRITVFPAGITVAASFNRRLMELRGAALGYEAKKKGVNVMLGPSIGPLGAYQQGGRNWEGFGSDAYLQGVAARYYVRGMQGEGVTACAKHFLGNEQERFRRGSESAQYGFVGVNASISSAMTMKSIREVYGWPFEEVIDEGVGCVMCAYNMVNNTYSCENSGLLNGVLKRDMGFQGFVVSDWVAQMTGVDSALAGMDMTMPGDMYAFNDGRSFWGGELSRSILNGSIPETRLDDMVMRIVATWYKMGQDKDFPETSFSSWFETRKGPTYYGAKAGAIITQNHFIDARNNSEESLLAVEVAEQGTVLLKNEGILPLSRNGSLKAMGVFGRGAIINPKGPNSCPDRICSDGTLGQGWGSGTADYFTFSEPLSVLQDRADEYGIELKSETSVFNAEDAMEIAAEVDAKNGTCIVFVSSNSGEGYGRIESNIGDRTNLDLWHMGADYIKFIASVCRRTVVTIHAVGPVKLEQWINHANVSAVLHAHLPGQAAGDALANILFGDTAPSGKLPYTLYTDDAVDHLTPKVLEKPNHPTPQVILPSRVDYQDDVPKEGILFPFGFGLTYTTFNISNVTVTHRVNYTRTMVNNFTGAPIVDVTHPSETPLPTWPEDFERVDKYIYPYLSEDDIPSSTVTPTPTEPTSYPPPRTEATEQIHTVFTFLVANVGNFSGHAVPQLYLQTPTDPTPKLRGFDKVLLAPGKEVKLELTLRWRDLASWSEDEGEDGGWVLNRGTYKAWVAQDAGLKNAGEVEWEW